MCVSDAAWDEVGGGVGGGRVVVTMAAIMAERVIAAPGVVELKY